MRLFRRRDNEAPSTPDPEGPALGAPGGGADDGVARPPRQPIGDWMTVAPLAPSFSPTMPTTFRVQTLPEILTSHRDTRLSSSLGHTVSPDAPSGSVAGLATHAAQDVTHAGDVSHVSGMGNLELREPAHHAAPEAPALEVRRLADPSPISSSSPSLAPMPPAPQLPEPAVSRALLDTAPLVARPAAERPLPVARVVDAPAAAAASAAASHTAPEPAGFAAPDRSDVVGPLGDDEPLVSGFGVDLDGSPSLPVADDTPRSAPPAELAPPIQPRRVQRRTDPAAATASLPSAPLVGDPVAPGAAVEPLGPVDPESPAGPAGGGALPLVQRPATTPAPVVARLGDAANTTPSAPAEGAPATPTASVPSSSADTRGSETDVVVARLADPAASAPTAAPLAGAHPLPATVTEATDVPASTQQPTRSSGELPLHAPSAPGVTPTAASPSPVQRSAEPSPGADREIEPRIQRLADAAVHASTNDTSSAGASSPDGPEGGVDVASTASTTSLVGDAPIATPSAGDDRDDPADADEAATSATPAELPLVEPARPTVGATGEPLTQVQPMGDGAGPTAATPSPGTAGLPLAPSDLGPTLTPPVAPAAPPVADVQRLAEASSSSTARPLVSPAAANGGPSVQRAAANATSHATSSGTTTLPFVRPLAAPSATPAAPSLSIVGGPQPAAPGDPLPVQLRRIASPDLGAPVATVESLAAPATQMPAGDRSASLPLTTPVQRLDSSTSRSIASSAAPASTSAEGRSLTAELPLHTPATSIPSAADVAVRAGLAERGPDGSLFTTSPPTTFVQRQASSGSGTDAENGDGAGDGLSIQRIDTTGMGEVQHERSPVSRTPSEKSNEADAASDTKKLAADAKKLYPYIRSALEADIRRQLEGKSRASRYRP